MYFAKIGYLMLSGRLTCHCEDHGSMHERAPNLEVKWSSQSGPFTRGTALILNIAAGQSITSCKCQKAYNPKRTTSKQCIFSTESLQPKQF
ncbi:hypothetical protein ASPTUDRAFT_51665 [Aspergillus tubingensis CBS 134.48]|uniref:Uncharacterized protein n=1 Tax=Aspergillus tubingensis (strain CBS 134.48) TaxID=767770 RepID=A0A1L9NE69_ASPTC|nr:hypothetical protein ASPTUDRAFT_51665 [Aspergillus tubingensis CBS 134.48]